MGRRSGEVKLVIGERTEKCFRPNDSVAHTRTNTGTHVRRHRQERFRTAADASVNGDGREQRGKQMVGRTKKLERIGRGKSINTSQLTANVHTGTPRTIEKHTTINEQLHFNNRKRRESHRGDGPGKVGGGEGGERRIKPLRLVPSAAKTQVM